MYGIDLATIVRGLESADQVPGRLERIECGQPFGVFVDYAHTPDAIEYTTAQGFGCSLLLRSGPTTESVHTKQRHA